MYQIIAGLLIWKSGRTVLPESFEVRCIHVTCFNQSPIRGKDQYYVRVETSRAIEQLSRFPSQPSSYIPESLMN